MAHGLGRRLVLGLAVAGLGCGGAAEDPLARASGAPMAPAPLAGSPPAADANGAPEIEAVWLEPDPPVPGDTLRAVVRAEDPDGDPLQLDFTWTVGGRRAAARGAELPLSFGSKGDLVRVLVRASDGMADSASVEATTTIRNRPPRLRGETRIEAEGPLVPGVDLVVHAEGEDPDGDTVILSYTWVVNGRTVGEGEARFSTAGLQRGDRVLVRVRASDGSRRSSAWLSPELEIGNAPPRIVSRPEPADEEGGFRYAVRVEDPDGDRIFRFRLAAAPDGMTIDPRKGVVEWTPRSDQSGRHRVEVVVADAGGAEGVQPFELVVDPPPLSPPPANQAPAAAE